MGSVDGWPLASLETEQREVITLDGRRNGRSRALCPPPGAPIPHHPHGFGAVDGCPGERRVGKRIAVHGARGVSRGCCVRRVPRGRRPVT